MAYESSVSMSSRTTLSGTAIAKREVPVDRELSRLSDETAQLEKAAEEMCLRLAPVCSPNSGQLPGVERNATPPEETLGGVADTIRSIRKRVQQIRERVEARTSTLEI